MTGANANSITLAAPAKINLTLDVLGVRPDGYHEIASVMQTISLADHVTISPSPKGAAISLTVSGPEAGGVPADERNLAWKAARAFGAADVAIHIEKRIPTQAGLGGGSSDAASVLLTLNQLFGSRFTRAQLAEIGATLGADVPFFLQGGLAKTAGIGEKVAAVAPFPSFSLVVVKPPVGVSTAEAYRLLDETPGRESARATSRWPLGGFSNDFEPAIYARYPEIAAARDALREAGAKRILLCGSGSAVFGTTRDPEQITERVEAAGVGKAYAAHTLDKGVG